MLFKSRLRNLFLVIFIVIAVTACSQSNSSKVKINQSSWAEWEGTYKGVIVEGVTAQSYDNQDGSVYVIVRGRIINKSSISYHSFCVWAILESSDERIGGKSETCDSVYHMGRNQQGNFEVRIDNPTYGRWNVRFSISSR